MNALENHPTTVEAQTTGGALVETLNSIDLAHQAMARLEYNIFGISDVPLPSATPVQPNLESTAYDLQGRSVALVNRLAAFELRLGRVG